MDQGAMCGLGRLRAGALAILLSATGCAGKSERHGDEDGRGRGGEAGETGFGGATTGKGGALGKGGATGKGGAPGIGGTTGGDAGTAGRGVTVSELHYRSVDKMDLLFMIDNSISMGDKQRILAEAVPVLLERLVTPRCLDEDGNPTGDSSPCPDGSVPEFAPVEDIHVGIVTSSLGNHGGDVCVPDPNEMTVRTLNDQAQLLPTERSDLYSYRDSGFLVWDPREPRPAPDPHPGLSSHETDVNLFINDFADQVNAAGERGCGYESSLEAWYRFLVDPEPIASVTNDGTFSVRGQVNGVVLDQRRAFLRPDSLLAVVMLTDENDCSIIDENQQQGWLVGRRIQMPRGSSECARPEDPDAFACCRPCVVDKEGCPPSQSDAECQKGATLTPIEDSTNLRCFRQKERLGVDFLYPFQRYVDALTSTRISPRDVEPGAPETVLNPIFTPGADGTPARSPSQAILVGIVGVPWQDLADESSFDGRGLTYLDARELADKGRWDVILGDPERGVPPQDPFMIDSVDERTGTNPVTDDNILPSSATGGGNGINGHEQNVIGRDDLQYACTFDLVPDVPCTMANQDACDCNASEQANNRSLCSYSGTGEGTQVRSKAYPGIRQLQVLRALGENGVTASICPKNVTGEGASDPAYGYNPAVGAMIGRVREALVPGCLASPLPSDGAGRTTCTVVEARLPGSACTDPGRSDLVGSRGAVEAHLESAGYCGSATGVDCSTYALCEILPFGGEELFDCLTNTDDPGTQYGYCYVDPDEGLSNQTIVSGCPSTARRTLRFMGSSLPAQGSAVLLVCDAN